MNYQRVYTVDRVIGKCIYIEQLEQYIVVNVIAADKQMSLLLTSVGEDNTISVMCATLYATAHIRTKRSTNWFSCSQQAVYRANESIAYLIINSSFWKSSSVVFRRQPFWIDCGWSKIYQKLQRSPTICEIQISINDATKSRNSRRTTWHALIISGIVCECHRPYTYDVERPKPTHAATT